MDLNVTKIDHYTFEVRWLIFEVFLLFRTVLRLS